MDWITENVAIGHFVDAHGEDQIRKSGFRSAVSLDGTLKPEDTCELPYERICAVPLEDTPANDPRLFLRALEDLEACVGKHPPVLVQCHADRRRSVVLVAAYPMRKEQIHAEEAWARASAKRASAVTVGLERLLDHV